MWSTLILGLLVFGGMGCENYDGFAIVVCVLLCSKSNVLEWIEQHGRSWSTVGGGSWEGFRSCVGAVVSYSTVGGWELGGF